MKIRLVNVVSENLSEFNEEKLDREATVAKFATVQLEGGRQVSREIE